MKQIIEYSARYFNVKETVKYDMMLKLCGVFFTITLLIIGGLAAVTIWQNSQYKPVEYGLSVTIKNNTAYTDNMQVASQLHQIYSTLTPIQKDLITSDTLFSIDTGIGTIMPDKSNIGDPNYLLGEQVNAKIVVRNVDTRELNTARVVFQAFKLKSDGSNQSLARFEKVFTDLHLEQYEDYAYNLSFTIPSAEMWRGRYHIVVTAADERGQKICNADEYVSIL